MGAYLLLNARLHLFQHQVDEEVDVIQMKNLLSYVQQVCSSDLNREPAQNINAKQKGEKKKEIFEASLFLRTQLGHGTPISILIFSIIRSPLPPSIIEFGHPKGQTIRIESPLTEIEKNQSVTINLPISTHNSAN